jgi:hypothetical protein
MASKSAMFNWYGSIQFSGLSWVVFGLLWDCCVSFWIVVGSNIVASLCLLLAGCCWIVVDHCGVIVAGCGVIVAGCGVIVAGCGSLWLVWGHCGSLFIVVACCGVVVAGFGLL